MVGLDSGEAAAPAVILYAACHDSTPWSISLIYLLRCPTLISFSIKNFRLCQLSVSCHDLNDNCTARICFFGRDPFESVHAI